VYGDQSKDCDDIEDFALLRSNGMPTYHLASCADDSDLLISHIIRGQDHLTNTFKHVLMPVWISAYRYRDKVYRFLVNGQTGEASGESPLSWWKVLLLAIVGLILLWIWAQGE
jgi:hypothetical protein